MNKASAGWGLRGQVSLRLRRDGLDRHPAVLVAAAQVEDRLAEPARTLFWADNMSNGTLDYAFSGHFFSNANHFPG